MSETITFPTALLCALFVAVSPVPGESQTATTDAYPDAGELEDEVEELYRAFRSVNREVQDLAAESAGVPTAEERLADLAVGPLRILALPGDTAEARRAFQAVWPEYEAMTEGAESMFQDVRFLFVGRGSEVPELTMEARVVRIDPGLWYSPSRVRSGIGRGIGKVVVESLPDAIGEWTNSTALPSSSNLTSAFSELIAAPSRAARQCFEIGGIWCWEAAGVTDAPAPLLRWYAPEELVALARDPDLRPRSMSERRLRDACLSSGEADPCSAYVADRSGVRPPLGNRVKLSMLRFALDRGGAGAVARMLEGDASSVDGTSDVRSVNELLARAAGTGIDNLTDEWRSAVLASRPRPYLDLPRTASSAIVWTLILGTLATRSSRWRLD